MQGQPFEKSDYAKGQEEASASEEVEGRTEGAERMEAGILGEHDKRIYRLPITELLALRE